MNEPETLPKVRLSRQQWLRLVAVGIFAVFVLARVVPDAVRIAQPLGLFFYATNHDGVVTQLPNHRTKGSDAMLLGDRVRIDRIKPFDRKPGLAGFSYTREDFTRRLPIARHGKDRILTLQAENEPLASRVIALVRIIVFFISVALGAILFLVKPSIATFGFFVFCLGGEYPTTFADVVLPVPWREVPSWLGDTLRGAAQPGLMLFVLCLLSEEPRYQRTAGFVCAAAALLLGSAHAYASWLMNYAGRPGETFELTYVYGTNAVAVLAALAFMVAFVRTRRIARIRIGWIGAGFTVGGIAHFASQALYPGHIPFWANSALRTMTVVPIVVVWIAVVKTRFFNVDFVVSRAIVYVAITATVIGIISVSEELITYLFYNNTDLAYGFIIAISIAFGALTGKIKGVLDHLVDRFIFRDRKTQREALEFIAGYILDAETVDDVYRALLRDAAHALKLTFGGIMTRTPEGGFELTYGKNWPEDCATSLPPHDELTHLITRSRSVLTFNSKETRLLQSAFPNERLTFAAPLFFDRSVSAIVVYGHNVSGLDLDPEERQLLVRVVAHASIALNAIELSRYRATHPMASLPTAQSLSGLHPGID